MTPEHPLKFLDCNCGVGPYLGGPANSVDALLQKMDALGIAEACPFALSEYDGECGSGNAWVAQAARGNARLHPVWVLGPHHCGEYPAPRDIPAMFARAGVRMARAPLGKMVPLKTLDLCLMEELLDVLCERRIPLLLDCQDSSDQAGTQDLKTILQRWSALPVIVTFPKLEQTDRRLYYLWERFDRLYVDLSPCQTLGGIEAVTQRFGSNRLVFGSRFPFFTPLQTMLQVIYSQVDDTVKADIAGGTVRRLLGEAKP
jgi:hypothetical protein